MACWNDWKTDFDEIKGPANRVGSFALIMFALTTALVLWVSYLFSRRFLREGRRQEALIHGIVGSTHSLASASEELSSVSQTLSANAEQTTAQALSLIHISEPTRLLRRSRMPSSA